MDLCKTLTLDELAKRLEPQVTAAWRTLSDVLSGEAEMSLRYLRNQERREVAKSRAYRQSLVARLNLDDQLVPGRMDYPFLAKRLLEATDLEVREEHLMEEAGHLAKAEVRGLSRRRLARARDRLGRRVMVAVRSALRANGTSVNGIEVLETPVGPVLKERAEISAKHLAHARIDILTGSLMDAAREWRQVTVHLGQMPGSDERRLSTDASYSDHQLRIKTWGEGLAHVVRQAGRRIGKNAFSDLAEMQFGRSKVSERDIDLVWPCIRLGVGWKGTRIPKAEQIELAEVVSLLTQVSILRSINSSS